MKTFDFPLWPERLAQAALPERNKHSFAITIRWYYEAYLEEEDALGREQFLKSGSGRRFLKNQLRHYLAKHPLRRTALRPAA